MTKSKYLIPLLLLSLILGGALLWQRGQLLDQIAIMEATQEAAQQEVKKQIQAERLRSTALTHLLDSKLEEQLTYLAGSKTIVEALADFKWGFDNYQAAKAASFDSTPLKDHYREHFTEEDQTAIDTYFPKDPVAIYFQSFYLAGMRDWDKNHPYHYIPDYYGADLELATNAFQWRNIYLVTANGKVVYTAKPDPLLGIDLNQAPYSETAAGLLFQKLKTGEEKSITKLESEMDCKPYLPCHPSGAAVYSKDEVLGYLLVGQPM